MSYVTVLITKHPKLSLGIKYMCVSLHCQFSKLVNLQTKIYILGLLLLNGFINIPNISINTTSAEGSDLLECATVLMGVYQHSFETQGNSTP